MNSTERLRLDVSGLGQERTLEVCANPIWLGRDPACHVVLPSTNVSRRHAKIECTASGLSIQDASSNGTLVNDRWLRNASLALGDAPATLQLGSFSVCVRRASPERTATHSSPGQPSATPPAAANPEQPKSREVPGSLRRQLHRRLVEHLDLNALDRSQMNRELLRPQVEAALRRIIADMGTLSLAEADDLIRELRDEVLGLGPLETLLEDPDVCEVMVVDPQTIFVERAGKVERTALKFTDADSVRAVIERIVTPLGRRIDESTPLVDARLPDGSRVNAVIPPLALRGPCITIRKFPHKPLGMDDLLELGSVSSGMARFLEAAVMIRKNIVISGGTGSGKTTLLNVLSAAIPADERVVTIEDAAELRLLQPHVVSLEARPPNLEGKGEYTIRDLLKNALRMRPDRIVVGECRGGEAVDMLQAMNTGHEGSLTTTHANSPREAVSRIETLCLMAGLELPIAAVRRQIATSIHLIVQQARFGDGVRRVTHVSEVVGLSDRGDVELRDLFVYHKGATGNDGEFLTSGQLPSFMPEFLTRGLLTQGLNP